MRWREEAISLCSFLHAWRGIASAPHRFGLRLASRNDVALLGVVCNFYLFYDMVFIRGGCVYIMTNLRHSVLYVGVTSDLLARVSQHKSKFYPNSFTSKYNCNDLVYYCFYPRIEEAIAIEKAIKGGSRQDKVDLINSMNPEWKDLYTDLLNE